VVRSAAENERRSREQSLPLRHEVFSRGQLRTVLGRIVGFERYGNMRALKDLGVRCNSGLPVAIEAIPVNAPVAQLDRAPGYEPGGREFESLRARQFHMVRSGQIADVLYRRHH
jgi:hypothetical protein